MKQMSDEDLKEKVERLELLVKYLFDQLIENINNNYDQVNTDENYEKYKSTGKSYSKILYDEYESTR